MTTLNNYLLSLIEEVKSAHAARRDPEGDKPVSAEENKLPPSATPACRLRSIEFTIPIAIHQVDQTSGKVMSSPRLRDRTMTVIREAMHLDRFPKARFFRLRNALEIEGKRLDALLLQENILIERALKDYIQRIVATAYDEYVVTARMHSMKDERAPCVTGNAITDFSLDELTESITENLLPEIWQALDESKSDAISVTVESHKLKDYPANQLTYVKMLISEEDLMPGLVPA